MFDQALLSYLLAMAVALSGYPEMAVEDLPAIQQLPPNALHAAACDDGAAPCENLAALFDSQNQRILISNRLDPADPADNSFLVHEFVHVLQYRQLGESYSEGCEATLAAEREAYRVQNAYLRRAGRLERYGDRLTFMACAARQPSDPTTVVFEPGGHRPSDNDIFDAFMATLRRPPSSAQMLLPVSADPTWLQPGYLHQMPPGRNEWQLLQALLQAVAAATENP
ncbi:MAG TPA: DUF6647 family protein [Rhodocyclaceae bacterium]